MAALKRTLEASQAVGFLFLALIGIGFAGGSGCATGRDGAAAGEEGSALSGPRPSSTCEQYLALLSDERKQSLLAEYGTGGSCWTSGKQQEQQCNETCSQGVNQIIRANLQKSAS